MGGRGKRIEAKRSEKVRLGGLEMGVTAGRLPQLLRTGFEMGLAQEAVELIIQRIEGLLLFQEGDAGLGGNLALGPGDKRFAAEEGDVDRRGGDEGEKESDAPEHVRPCDNRRSNTSGPG